MNPNLYRTVLAVNVLMAPVAALAQEQAAPAAAPPPAVSATTGSPSTTDQPIDQPTEPNFVPNESMPTAPGPGPVSPTAGASFGEPLAGTSQLGGPAALGGMPLDSQGLFRWGKFNLHPDFSYRVSYGDSLSRRVGEQSDSWIHEFSPGILINLGEDWSLDYTPTMRWYSDEHFSDVVNHRVYLRGGTTFKDWALSLSQGFSRTTDPLIETGAQTEEDTYATSIKAGRSLNSKLSVDLGIAQDFRFVDGNSSSRRLSDRKSWSTMDWLDYQYIERLSFGVGAGFTYDDVQYGSDMTSEQMRGRIRWIPGNKLSLSLSGGFEVRQFLDSNVSDMVSPLFALTAGYKLFETTSLFISASHSVSPSYYSDSVSESTGLNGGINQRLLGRLFLNVNGGYTTRDYTDTAGTGAKANQDYYSLNASLGMGLLKRGSVSIFYNKIWYSDSSTYDYDPQTVGAQVGYRF